MVIHCVLYRQIVCVLARQNLRQVEAVASRTPVDAHLLYSAITDICQVTTAGMSGKVLVDSVDRAVIDAIDGLLLTRSDLVAIRDAKVVLRAETSKNATVSLISGGGAGHEPAHGGLVASGMLTAAVSGNVFASPNVSQIVTAIRAVTRRSSEGGKGVLLIVKSYTGDKLAFGLAAETAKGEGYDVDTVFVGDDAAVDAGHIAGRRGIAGTVLVHKVAGALAEAGAPLAVVAAAARHVASTVVSMGASLTVCSVPGVAVSTRLGPGSESCCELGLGIHGEPGQQALKVLPTATQLAQALVRACVDRLYDLGVAAGVPQPQCPSTQGGASTEASCAPLPLAVLVNNLGGLSNLEQAIFTSVVVKTIEAMPCVPRLRVERLYSAPLMTSLDMKGVSMSLLPVAAHQDDAEGKAQGGWERWSPAGQAWQAAGGLCDHAGTWNFKDGSEGELWSAMDVLDCLDAPTACPHWPSPTAAGTPGRPHAAYIAAPAVPAAAVVATSTSASSPALRIHASTALSCLSAAEAALHAREAEIGQLDALAGDGDAGETYARMGTVARQAVQQSLATGAETIHLQSLLSCVGASIAKECGGTSGVLYALMLTASAAHAGSEEGAAQPTLLHALASCLKVAVDAASRYGGARAGDRTFLDVLVPVQEAMARVATDATAPLDFKSIGQEALAAAQRTAAMAPSAGRAAYVKSEVVQGHADAGAVASAAWIAAMVNALA